MAKLKCPECGNNKTWERVIIKRGKYEAECYECRHVVTGEGGVEVGTVVGQMVMDF